VATIKSSPTKIFVMTELAPYGLPGAENLRKFSSNQEEHFHKVSAPGRP